jgi:threonine dehydrogenase-like Zn-dependent dehydrogenase
MMIGACADTGGGWGDSFIAHRSQLHRLPNSIETERAVLAPELARAVRVVLQHPPSPGDHVIIMGSGSLGLLVVLVFEMLGYEVNLLVVAEHPFEVDIARRVTGASVVLADGSGTVYEEVAEFVGGSVRYPRIGPTTLEGGADLVYETTGRRDFVEDGLRFSGEGKRFVLVGMKQARALDLVSVWLKGVKILGPGWSKREFFDGTMTDVMDVALALMERHSLPIGDLVTHRFTLAQYHQAFSTLENRSATRAMKAIFHHVV